MVRTELFYLKSDILTVYFQNQFHRLDAVRRLVWDTPMRLTEGRYALGRWYAEMRAEMGAGLCESTV